MRRTLIGTCIFILSLYVAAPCSAGLIVASGAGSTIGTAEDLTGLYPTEIVGTLDGNNLNDASFFKISNLQPWNFSALTVLPEAFGIPDTVLSLFDSTGVGVYLNDDISGSNTLSCLHSLSSNPCPASGIVLPGGIYYLAVSRGANYPLDGFGNEIFNPLSSTDVVGPSSTNQFGSWDGGAFTSPDFDLVNYQIDLTGTVPEPASWLLTAGAILVLGRLRRRR